MKKHYQKKYEKYTVMEKGKPVIYVRLLKALYGTLKAVLLFWENLSEALQEWGFKINPHGWCVANKTINGKQYTIGWHVQNLELSHIDSEVVYDIINKLDKRYGKEAPMVTTRGKIHDYLGMALDYNIDVKVQITMFEYIAKIIVLLQVELLPRVTKRKPVIRRLSQQRHHYLTC